MSSTTILLFFSLLNCMELLLPPIILILEPRGAFNLEMERREKKRKQASNAHFNVRLHLTSLAHSRGSIFFHFFIVELKGHSIKKIKIRSTSIQCTLQHQVTSNFPREFTGSTCNCHNSTGTLGGKPRKST